MSKSNGNLNEAQLRYLSRIARQMRDRASSEIRLVLESGGVRDYTETSRIQAKDLESDEVLAREVGGW